VNITYPQQDGNAKYDSFQVEVSRKVGSFAFDAHYTLANSMADYLNLENPYSHKFWNHDQYTSRHRAVGTAYYQLPFGKGRQFMTNAPGAVDAVLGGWRAMWVTTLQSGQYFTPSFSGSDPSHTNTVGGIPDRIANGNLPPDQRKVERWFDPTAFAVPAQGRFGNSGVNILEGPGIAQHNVSVIKQFKATERIGVEFQAMILDLFNTPTFLLPATATNANISVPAQVGRLTSTLSQGDPGNATIVSSRNVILRLRVVF
jgi:hypothetical protein